MKQVIIVTPGFPANENDSSSLTYLQDYCTYLAERIGSDHIKIISTQYPYTNKPYQWNGIAVYPVGGRNKKGIFRIINFIRTLLVLKKQVTGSNSVIHTYWLSDAAWAGSVFGKFRKLPVIVNLMGQDAQKGNFYLKLIAGKPQFVAISEWQANVFRQHCKAYPIIAIPLPLARVTTSPIISRQIDLLFVASYIDVKQPLQFVEIVHRVRKQHAGVRAVMIGAGPLKKAIEEKMQQLQLSQNLVVYDAMPRNDVFQYMQRSKIQVHTASFEGQCMVYGESLLHGMYLLSYPVGFIADTPKHITCSSIDEFVLNIMQLLSQPLTFTPVNSIDTDTIMDAYSALYQ